MPRRLVLVALVASALVTPGSALRALTGREAVPISYVCPMDAEILESHGGPCPICGMTLQPARVEAAWGCPRHRAVTSAAGGRCPLDGREFVPVIANHFWACSDDGRTQYAEAGRCRTGAAREERRVVRAHGDHNPRHGGQFFMSADQDHHLEGTHPSAGIFRVYAYDSYTQPISTADISGRVFTTEAGDQEIDSVALSTGPGETLEARIASGALPLRIVAKIKLSPNAPEQRFDFLFGALTKETAGSLAGGAKATHEFTPPLPPSPPSSPRRPAALTTTTTIIADDRTEVLRLLDTRTQEIRTLIDEGNYVSVYVPTMIAKDVALQLAARPAVLTITEHERVSNALRHIVVAAWTLDRYGDLGDRDQLAAAHRDFARWVAQLRDALEEE